MNYRGNARFRPNKVNVNKDVVKDWMGKLGLQQEGLCKVKDSVELRSFPPNFIIAESIKKFSFSQGKEKTQQLEKKGKYIMSLSMFQSLWADKNAAVQFLKPATVKFKNVYRPYNGTQDLTNKSLLFIRHGGIGDLLFCNVLLRYIKEHNPTCKIGFCCGSQYVEMIEGWPDLIDEIIYAPISLSKFVSYNYHATFEGIIERNNEAERVNAYELFRNYLNLPIPSNELIPKQIPKSHLLDELKIILKNWNSDLINKSFIIVQMSASSPIRMPNPKLFWKPIIEKLVDKGHYIVLADSKHNEERVQKFIDELDSNKKDKVFNFAKFSLSSDYCVALTSYCKLVIAVDSAYLHIAASIDKPLFGVYGPFPGELRLSTFKNADWINADTKFCHGPCYLHGYNPCPKSKDGFSPCYLNINPDELIFRAEKLINV